MRIVSTSLFRFSERVALIFLLVLEVNAGGVILQRGPNRIDVSIDGRPFTTYFYGSDVSKAYLMPLRSAGGVILSRDFPVGNDVSKGNPKASSFEPHQRGLYFAHGDIDGLNFWAEPAFQKYYGKASPQPYGRMVNTGVEELAKNTIRASFSLEDPNRRVIGDESQQFVFRGDQQTRIIDCEFTLRATHGPIAIGDTKEGTFGIRLRSELSAPFGQMINSHGARGEPDIWGKAADWVDYSGTVSGKPVGIVVFDHPQSFRHPTTWHARGYGLLAANPFALREFSKDPQKDSSWTIVEDVALTFRYRVLIYDGVMRPAQIAEAYTLYARER
jgi:Methane oxygenase PmoA